MTAVSSLRCDARPNGPEGLPCDFQDEPPGSPRTATQARARLAKQGWHRRPGGRDICPSSWNAGLR